MTDGTTEYKTLRVPEDAWADAREQKEAAGRTWGEQIVRPDGEADDVALGDGYEEIADRIAASIDFPTADVEAAVRRVITDELPDEVFR